MPSLSRGAGVVASIPAWENRPYPARSQVYHSGSAWIAPSGASAGQEPGVHGAWEKFGGGESDSLATKLSAELATTSGTPGKLAFLRGVSTDGIGRGDVELVEDAELEHDPVGGVFESGLPNHFFVRPDRTYRYEEEFLAHPTASASDNYEGINRGVHDCATKRTKFILRGGAYSVGGPIDIEDTDYACIEGAARKNTILLLTQNLGEDAFVTLGGGDKPYYLCNLTIDAAGLAADALRLSTLIASQSTFRGLTLERATSKQLHVDGVCVSLVMRDLVAVGGEYGIYSNDTLDLSSAVFDRVRISNTSISGVYLSHDRDSSVHQLAFNDPEIGGNKAAALYVNNGHIITIRGGHWEQNCREQDDGADILMGSPGPLCLVIMDGTMLARPGDPQFPASPEFPENIGTFTRVRFHDNYARLVMRDCHISTSHRIDGAGKTVGSRITIYGEQQPLVVGMHPNGVIRWPNLRNSAWWDPPSLADGAQQSTTVSVPGAVLGDTARVAFTNALQGTRLWAEVTANDTVTVYHSNNTGETVDLLIGQLIVSVDRTWGGSTP